MLTTADKVGLGVGVLALAGIGYEVWKNGGLSTPTKVYKDISPNNLVVYSSKGYRQVVNDAQGYSVTLTNGQHQFIGGEYPLDHTTGLLSTAFVPNGVTYIWGTGNVKQG